MAVDLDELNPQAEDNFRDSIDSSSWSNGVERSVGVVFGRRWERGLRRAGVENTDDIGEVWSEGWENGWEEYKNSDDLDTDSTIWEVNTRNSSTRWKENWEEGWGDVSNWDV